MAERGLSDITMGITGEYAMDINTENKYRNAWCCVHAAFQEGFCISERGLQSALASALNEEFPEKKLVIEPVWEIPREQIRRKRYLPDIVLVEDMKISDIFELKFVPHSYAKFERDIEKLSLYSASSNERFPVQINQCTGRWTDEEASIRKDCQFHFVAVAQADAAAVCTESLKVGAKFSGTGRFNHWYGRVGEVEHAKWGIGFGI